MSVTHLLRVTTGYGDFADSVLVRTTAGEADAGARALTHLVGTVEHLVLDNFDDAAAGVAVYRDLAGFRRAFNAEANAPGYVADSLTAPAPSAAYFDTIWDGSTERVF